MKGGFFLKLREMGLIPKTDKSGSEIRLSSLYKTLEDEAEDADFSQEPFLQECKFRLFKPSYINVDSVRDYFGEKIALYFTFLSFVTRQLGFMSVLGILFTILQSATDNLAWVGLTYIFGIIVNIWSTVFIEMWKREEAIFAIRYG